jgi:hypothetical protein
MQPIFLLEIGCTSPRRAQSQGAPARESPAQNQRHRSRQPTPGLTATAASDAIRPAMNIEPGRYEHAK